VWTAPSWQGKSSRRIAGRCSHVFGLLARRTGPLAIMPSADRVPVRSPHSIMHWHLWVVLIAGNSTHIHGTSVPVEEPSTASKVYSPRRIPPCRPNEAMGRGHDCPATLAGTRFEGARFVRSRSSHAASRSGAPLLHFFQDAIQVVGLRRLQRWEFLLRREFLPPQKLADGQHVPVVDIGSAWRRQCTLNVC
jgi:hypothetical protein